MSDVGDTGGESKLSVHCDSFNVGECGEIPVSWGGRDCWWVVWFQVLAGWGRRVRDQRRLVLGCGLFIRTFITLIIVRSWFYRAISKHSMSLLRCAQSDAPPFRMKWHTMFWNCTPDESRHESESRHASTSVQFQNIVWHFWAEERAMHHHSAWSDILCVEIVRQICMYVLHVTRDQWYRDNYDFPSDVRILVTGKL